MPADFYDLLDVSPGASSEQLKRAYREKARQYHPDVNADARSNDQFKVIRTAYEVLSDAKERADYDRMGHSEYVEKRLDGTVGSTGTRANRPSSGESAARTVQRRENRTTRQSSGRTHSTGSTSKPKSTWGSRTIAEPGARARAMRSGRRSARPVLGVTAGLGYLLGLVTFLAANAPAFDGIVTAVVAGDPSAVAPAVLADGFDTTWTTIEQAVSSPSFSLLFPAGMVAYPAFLAAASWQSSRTVDWVWTVCALGPLLGVGLDAAVISVPIGIDLLLFAVLPGIALLGPFVVAVRALA